jgi:fructose-bisphosphate aldolase / 2-amino-3,7-dideoxy-D-threo-hept-6-ulosonate synthase
MTMMDGKTWRLRRILNPLDGKTLILPMDHGLSMGPIHGLVRPADFLSRIKEAAPDAIVLNKGLVRFLPRDLPAGTGLIVHLSAGTELGPQDVKVRVTGVDDALSQGADAVSVHINFNGPREAEMVSDLGRVADRCLALGLPLLVMVYLRGGKLPQNDPRGLSIAARACAELGADVVKLPWPDSDDAMREIVAGCPVPVVLAGGARQECLDSLEEHIQVALAAGAAGVAVGRNVFQNPDPAAVLARLAGLIHGRPRDGLRATGRG